MADRPIIFSPPMVRALLEGRKTQTRRIAKPKWNTGANPDFTGWRAERIAERRWQILCTSVGAVVDTPYAIGDRLWVREAHALVPSSAYRMSDGVAQNVDPADRDRACVYREGWERCAPRWRPSIHMPRWASRITLTVTDVRVQRLQDISEADIAAEGIKRGFSGGQHGEEGLYEDFSDLWNSLHGPDAWDANPWVVVPTFTVAHGNIDKLEIAND